ncbi:MAG: PAS domain S-box protein [Caulobacteraceae bacterium]
MFGRGDKQEMLASLEPYWPMESTAVFGESVVAAMTGKPHYTSETRFTSLDGRAYEVLFTACFPPDMLMRGKILVGNIDITAANRAKRELEDSERPVPHPVSFYAGLAAAARSDGTGGRVRGAAAGGVRDLARHIETAPGFVDHALQSIKIVEANRRTMELFGAPSPEALLGPVARLWSENPEVFRRSMQARFSGADRYEAEIKIRTFDGRVLDVLYVTDFPEAHQDNALGLACLIDVTERAKAQEMLARVRAEFAHAARVSTLGELTASIAHP